MQARGTVAAAAYGAEPDIAAWATACMLNPSRIEPAARESRAVQAAARRLADHADRGLARLVELGTTPERNVTDHAGRPPR